ncbi:hypothetical protein [Parasphingorhabdus sp.]|uniref:hypothetical protein n=1 Tax=Parasphingorhabdus sp. TaxID=2709688 RepID=UPI003D2BF5EE
MQKSSILLCLPLLLIGCSETPIAEQGDEEILEMENQIDAEAQSLEQAAEEAVQILEEEIEAELADDGVSAPSVDEEPVAAEQ